MARDSWLISTCISEAVTRLVFLRYSTLASGPFFFFHLFPPFSKANSLTLTAQYEWRSLWKAPDSPKLWKSDFIHKITQLLPAKVNWGRTSHLWGYFSHLDFFVWKLLENMKNDATFVAMRSDDHFGYAKMSKKAPRSIELNFFINCDKQKRFSQNERRRADLQKVASDFIYIIFAWGLSFNLSKFSDDFTPLSTLKDNN